MNTSVDIGTISARGQIAIPTDIRELLHWKDGEKVLFMVQNNTLLMKRVDELPWDELTRPLRDAAKRARLKESDVVGLVHRARKK